MRSSSLSPGRCFVYVLPCLYEDILKLGFSRDPMRRMRALHRRYFEFFDLEKGFLIETETVRDARRLERILARRMALHNAPSPLVIRRPAAGHTEWYRGAYDLLRSAARELATIGHRLHFPIAEWHRERLIASSDLLYAWSDRTFGDMQAMTGDEAATGVLRQLLLDVLDPHGGASIELEPLLPLPVWQWYRASRQR